MKKKIWGILCLNHFQKCVLFIILIFEIDQLLNGRAYARAMTAHALWQQALSKIIFSNLKNNNEEFATLVNDEANSCVFKRFHYTEIIENDVFKKFGNFRKQIKRACK